MESLINSSIAISVVAYNVSQGLARDGSTVTVRGRGGTFGVTH